jgi:hypothetical protein
MMSARSLTVLGLLVAAAFSRLVPHPHNVAPMAALALFAGAILQSKRWASIAALGSLFLSDLLLHVTFLAGWQPAWGFYPGQWAVYACTLATVGIGMLIQKHRNPATVIGSTIAASVLFYLITNLTLVYGADSYYPHTLQGVMTSYAAALPYFRNALLGNLFYGAVLFGAFAMAEAKIPALQRNKKVTVAL